MIMAASGHGAFMSLSTWSTAVERERRRPSGVSTRTESGSWSRCPVGTDARNVSPLRVVNLRTSPGSRTAANRTNRSQKPHSPS